VKPQSLSSQTREAVLEAAWELLAEGRRVDASLSEIAARAGVTRQSIYLGFGNRVGLLIAMARHADSRSLHARRMRTVSESGADDPEALIGFVHAWLLHLPEIYPVGILLSAAAVTDPEAAEVFRDRMVGSLHARYRLLLERLATAGHLAPGNAARGADLCWSLTHIDAWRQLVVERGWTPAAFRKNREALIRAFVLRAG
jgi:AcrR family transcriptional regulator